MAKRPSLGSSVQHKQTMRVFYTAIYSLAPLTIVAFLAESPRSGFYLLGAMAISILCTCVYDYYYQRQRRKTLTKQAHEEQTQLIIDTSLAVLDDPLFQERFQHHYRYLLRHSVRRNYYANYWNNIRSKALTDDKDRIEIIDKASRTAYKRLRNGIISNVLGVRRPPKKARRAK